MSLASSNGSVPTISTTPQAIFTFNVPSSGTSESYTVQLSYDIVNYVSGGVIFDINYINTDAVSKNIVIPAYGCTTTSCNHGMALLAPNTPVTESIICNPGTVITVSVMACSSLPANTGISYDVELN